MSAATAPYPERRHNWDPCQGRVSMVRITSQASHAPTHVACKCTLHIPCTSTGPGPALPGRLGVCPNSRMPHWVHVIDDQSAIACFQAVFVHACIHDAPHMHSTTPFSSFSIFTLCRYLIFTRICISHSRAGGPKTSPEMLFSFLFLLPRFGTSSFIIPTQDKDASKDGSTTVFNTCLNLASTPADTQNRPSHHLSLCLVFSSTP
ncbi:hypothetical protein B0T19DRAFT_286948 [Cercophora scortea]|uniref:Uncharacterized protein n=1 Tax=Cercophora scortea TaxID=314031 RepID=A0AAE0M2W9_9PEZI|nr:hypothetical protein B0T19DRAFT_286948 [Cercophora scortea]